MVESGTLRAHAGAVLAKAYAAAREAAANKTGLDIDTFPAENPWELDAALGDAGA